MIIYFNCYFDSGITTECILTDVEKISYCAYGFNINGKLFHRSVCEDMIVLNSLSDIPNENITIFKAEGNFDELVHFELGLESYLRYENEEPAF